MFRKTKFEFSILLISFIIIFFQIVPSAIAQTEFNNPPDQAVNYIYNNFTKSGVQDSDYGVGSYATYILRLAGINTDAWMYSNKSLTQLIKNDLVSSNIYNAYAPKVSAKVLAQDLLAMKELGKDDLAGQLLQALKDRHSVHPGSGFDNNIYSDITVYDLLGRAGYINEIDIIDEAISYILSKQNTDQKDPNYGSFGSEWGPDFVVTAQAIRALAYLDPDGTNEQVQTAIDNALNWLENQQQDDGGFSSSQWDDPLINTVEVIATLKVLGIDPSLWSKGEGGKTPIDYMTESALNEDGSFGKYQNVMDAVWALYGYSLLGNQTSDLASKAVNCIYNNFIESGAQDSDYGVGSYATYILRLAGINTDAWMYSNKSLTQLIKNDLVSSNIYNAYAPKVSAKVLAQDLLAMKELGKDDLAGQLLQALKDRHSVHPGSGFDNNIYSDITVYDLLGRAGYINEIDIIDEAISYILSKQNTDQKDPNYGSFGSEWGPDFVVTAQAIRALAYLDPDGTNEQVQTAIDNALNWLENQQQDDGGFSSSQWDDPLINTVEVIATLKVLGIDPSLWSKGEGGKTPIDYMTESALNEDGSFGKYRNVMDAVWALYGYSLLDINLGKQIFVTPTPVTLKVGESKQLIAKLQDGSDVTNVATWSVDDETIATVQQGKITALKAGQTIVRAVLDGVLGRVTVNVKSASSGGISSGCLVGIAVVGKNKERLFGPSTVEVSSNNPWGLTALGALDATGLSYEMSEEYEGFVDSIEGQRNSGTAGWMFNVNDYISSWGAKDTSIRSGDKIIWWYSNSMDDPAPKWSDLTSSTTSAITVNEAVQGVKDVVADLKNERVGISQAIDKIQNYLTNLKESEITQELKDKLAEVTDLIKQSLEKVPVKAFQVKLDGDRANINVDGGTIKSQIEAITKAVGLANKIKDMGLTDSEKLIQNGVILEAPVTQTAVNRLEIVFPSDAAKLATDSSLKLVVKTNDLILSLPSEALQTVLDTTSSVSKVEISYQKVDLSKIKIFNEGRVVGNKILDLNVAAITSDGSKQKPQTNFARRITVTFPLDGIDVSKLDVTKLAVYRQKQDGSWEYIGGTLSPDNSSISFETDHTSIYALMEYKKAFKDIKGHWAEKDIEAMAMRLIANGFSDGTFAPDKNLTRAQFAAFLIRTLGISEENPQKATFTDVSPGYWGYKAIETAYKNELISGIGGGKFDPERNITREEIAVMIVRALKKKTGDAAIEDTKMKELLAKYIDSSRISNWAREAVAICVEKGIISGKTSTTIVPLNSATRAEAIVMLEKLLSYLDSYQV